MGNNNLCTCLKPQNEKTVEEIKSDSYHQPPIETSFIHRKKSKSFYIMSKKSIKINNEQIEYNKNNENNSSIDKKSIMDGYLKKNNIDLESQISENEDESYSSSSGSGSASGSSSGSPSGSSSSRSSYSSSSSSKEESEQGIDSLIPERIKNSEKLFSNNFDMNNWKKFYKIEEQEISKIFELFSSYKKSVKIYSEMITKIQNREVFYKGEINEENNILYGELYYKTGEKYQGFFENGKLNGWGRHINSKGECFEGLFKNNILTGKGIIIKEEEKDGEKLSYYYEGDIKNFIKDGYGIEKNNDYKYEGEFKKDLKDGNGKVTYYKGREYYEGDFLKGEITGFGYYVFSNKNTYRGEFLNGKMHGKGIYKWANGNIYEGEYVDNIREGMGEYIWKEGKKYTGGFSKGKPHGHGILTIKGVSIECELEYGKLLYKIKSDDFNQSGLNCESEN